jgi:hypothetical protein
VAYHLPTLCLSSVCLLIVHAEVSSLALPLSLVHFQCSCPLCCCARLQFTVCYLGFFCGGSVCPEVVLAYPIGSWGNSERCVALTFLVCRMSCRHVWSQWWQLRWQWRPSSFLSVTCCKDVFHGLGIQGVKSLILVGALFLPSVAPTSQEGFGVLEFKLSASIP